MSLFPSSVAWGHGQPFIQMFVVHSSKPTPWKMQEAQRQLDALTKEVMCNLKPGESSRDRADELCLLLYDLFPTLGSIGVYDDGRRLVLGTGPRAPGFDSIIPEIPQLNNLDLMLVGETCGEALEINFLLSIREMRENHPLAQDLWFSEIQKLRT
jgi:hypothetical protein